MPFFERSVFLRALNFLRVRHPFALRYSFLYPLALTLLVGGAFFKFSPNVDVYGRDGLISQLSPFLAIFAPFFLAALAAVSTFQGANFLDAPFQMEGEVTLVIAGERGFPEAIKVTPRHFLSLLFGYCCVVSLTLFLLTIAVPLLSGGVSDYFAGWAAFVGWLGFGLFLFFFFQIILSTLLGVYYLSDKFHR